MSVGLDLGDAVDDALAEGGVDLLLALHDVEGDDGSVGESAGQGSTDHTLEVVRGVVLLGSHNLLITDINNKS